MEVSARAGVEVLCTRSNLEGEDPLRPFRPDRDNDSGQPAVTVNEYGRGQAFYIAGDVGGAYMSNPYPPLKRFVVSLVKRTQPPFEIEGPEALDVTAAQRPSGEWMIHLINNPAPLIPWRLYSQEDADLHGREVGAFHATTELVPIHDVVVQFNDLDVKSARLPLQGIDLEVTGGRVVVPKIELHEVLLVESGS